MVGRLGMQGMMVLVGGEAPRVLARCWDEETLGDEGMSGDDSEAEGGEDGQSEDGGRRDGGHR